MWKVKLGRVVVWKAEEQCLDDITATPLKEQSSQHLGPRCNLNPNSKHCKVRIMHPLHSIQSGAIKFHGPPFPRTFNSFRHEWTRDGFAKTKRQDLVLFPTNGPHSETWNFQWHEFPGLRCLARVSRVPTHEVGPRNREGMDLAVVACMTSQIVANVLALIHNQCIFSSEELPFFSCMTTSSSSTQTGTDLHERLKPA